MDLVSTSKTNKTSVTLFIHVYKCFYYFFIKNAFNVFNFFIMFIEFAWDLNPSHDLNIGKSVACVLLPSSMLVAMLFSLYPGPLH